MLHLLQRLEPALLERYLQTRDYEKLGIPEPLAKYIEEINYAANLHKKCSSMLSCAKKLKDAFPHLSLSTCRSRVNDSINFFYLDCNVTADAWNMYFADQMEKLRDVALVAHNLPVALRCTQEARKYRIEAAAATVNPDETKYKQQIVSPDFLIDRMGLDRKGLLRAHKMANSIVDSLDASDTEKKRLRDEIESEIPIDDIDYEEE